MQHSKDYFFDQNTHCNCIKTISTLLMWFLGHNHLVIFKSWHGGEKNTNEIILLLTYKQKILQCVKCTYGTFYNKTREKYLCVSYYVVNSSQSFKSCSIDILVDHIRKQVYKLSIYYFCVEILANTQYLHHHDTNNRIFLFIFTI